MTNTENHIKGSFNHITYQPDVRVDTGATLTFHGGISYGTTLHKLLAGTMVVTGKPITSATWFQLEAGRLILDVENMSLRGSVSGDGPGRAGLPFAAPIAASRTARATSSTGTARSSSAATVS